MQTERFELRKKSLELIFDRKTIIKIWRDIVRNELRGQDIKDMFDCYDLNYNIASRSRTIRSDILKGTYRASTPLIYRIEKKHGICRHIVLPQPTDALVLQVLSESIIDKVIKNQPSEKAFYSRSKHNVKKVDELPEYGVSFRELWIKLQKTIYKFSQEKKLIVVTDLSNYYDSININELQKVLVKYCGDTDEVVTDLIFDVIKEISWKPDYLPYTGKGLPTTNLEAVRLMAHAFLYEIDEMMKNKSGDCFTRWMDDIIVGADSHKQAKEIVSAVSDMLKSRGLALNMAKTKILTPEEAMYHFQVKSNGYLNSIKKIEPKAKGYSKLTTEIKSNFKLHLKDRAPKYWDKVTKRYITTFGQMKSEKLLTEVVDLYVDHPELRPNLLMYLARIGYRKRTSDIVLKIVDSLDIFDDISLYQICNLVTDWEIPLNEQADKFIEVLEKKLTEICFQTKSSSDFYSLIWFMAKYSNGDKLLDFVVKYENLWRSEPFLRRQVTAVLSRLYITNQSKVSEILKSLIATGESSTVSIALQIEQFSELESSDNLLNFYLFPKSKQKVYPLWKFLVLCSVLNSKAIRTNEEIISKVKEYVTDPRYKKALAVYGL